MTSIECGRRRLKFNRPKIAHRKYPSRVGLAASQHRRRSRDSGRLQRGSVRPQRCPAGYGRHPQPHTGCIPHRGEFRVSSFVPLRACFLWYLISVSVSNLTVGFLVVTIGRPLLCLTQFGRHYNAASRHRFSIHECKYDRSIDRYPRKERGFAIFYV